MRTSDSQPLATLAKYNLWVHPALLFSSIVLRPMGPQRLLYKVITNLWFLLIGPETGSTRTWQLATCQGNRIGPERERA